MKAFFVLCAILSVIQVFFIGESTAWGEDYSDYISNNNENYRRMASRQNYGRFARRPPATGRRLAPRNRQTRLEDPEYYEQAAPVYNNYGWDNTGTRVQPTFRKSTVAEDDLVKQSIDLANEGRRLAGEKPLSYPSKSDYPLSIRENFVF